MSYWFNPKRKSRTEDMLRLDHFLPSLRRLKNQQQPPYLDSVLKLRELLPSSLVSNHQTKQRGLLRRWLRRLGPSWLYSPNRRMVQSFAFILFLLSFFYTCWPYNARPAPEPQSTSGWSVLRLEQNTGELIFTGGDVVDWLGEPLQVFGVRDGQESFAAFPVIDSQSEQLRLSLPSELPESLFDDLLTGKGQWTFHDRQPDLWPSHYADNFGDRELLPADTFLVIDPLVSLSTALADRSWVWSLGCAGIILAICFIVPRGFCGYLCPLGTTIDLFDWLIGKRVKRFRVEGDGWWVHIKYYLLAGTLVAASMGVLVSGFVSAIPVITRAALFVGEPLQTGLMRGWHLTPKPGFEQYLSVFLFLMVLCLGFFRERFWCKYVCPSGAVFSISNLLRWTDRKVEDSCIHCNKCVEVCPFDAIKPDFTTRGTDCTHCQTCAGVCPTHAIKFVERGNLVQLKVENDPPTHETSLGRRGFLSLAGGGAAASLGGVSVALATKALGGPSPSVLPIRPPGTVPEDSFLDLCIRCGECFKVCPNNVLQAEGFEQGLAGLWTPKVEADWAGCESSCNACGQVCPTGAIRALPMEEKRVARMGLAIVDETTCLPHAGTGDCDLCVKECQAAGYDAIEYLQVGTEVDDQGAPVPGSGYLAPVVLEDRCVGCGLCQTRCYAINVKEHGLLGRSAIIIEAGEGKEDRLHVGSYLELRRKESAGFADPSRNTEAVGDFTPGKSLPSTNESPFTDLEFSDDDAEVAVGEEIRKAGDDADNPFGL
ncbi:MAG: 4Fe-4S binding protein [Rubripirellula sp.]|nr:4Fe-4S binding protein [Rubripirellula sp.]